MFVVFSAHAGRLPQNLYERRDVYERHVCVRARLERGVLYWTWVKALTTLSTTIQITTLCFDYIMFLRHNVFTTLCFTTSCFYYIMQCSKQLCGSFSLRGNENPNCKSNIQLLTFSWTFTWQHVTLDSIKSTFSLSQLHFVYFVIFIYFLETNAPKIFWM